MSTQTRIARREFKEAKQTEPDLEAMAFSGRMVKEAAQRLLREIKNIDAGETRRGDQIIGAAIQLVAFAQLADESAVEAHLDTLGKAQESYVEASELLEEHEEEGHDQLEKGCASCAAEVDSGTRCGDCGEDGHGVGSMQCPSPKDRR